MLTDWIIKEKEQEFYFFFDFSLICLKSFKWDGPVYRNSFHRGLTAEALTCNHRMLLYSERVTGWNTLGTSRKKTVLWSFKLSPLLLLSVSHDRRSLIRTFQLSCYWLLIGECLIDSCDVVFILCFTVKKWKQEALCWHVLYVDVWFFIDGTIKFCK